MEDFIFGTLATERMRQARVRAVLSGVTHQQLRFPRHPLPGQPITLELTVGPAHHCQQAWIYWSCDGVDPRGSRGIAQHGSAFPMELVGIEWNTVLWGYISRYRVTLPGQPADTVLRYFIGAQAEEGEEILADGGACYACFVAEDLLPEWTRDAVIYEIFVDRFFPGDGKPWRQPKTPKGFYGGTLRGIREKLDYIGDLGANVLWLTPIFPSPSHHGYNATDYFEIEPRLGSKDDLRDLLSAAHQRAMRVLLDFVPNHWSNEHPTFQSAITDPASPYRDWYCFEHWPDQYETFFGVKTLPKINLRHPEARQYMLEAAVYWLDFGVDGYRLDYAIGPSPDFWADFRRVTRRTCPACWTFGEVVEPADSQIAFEGQLDGCLDFMLLEAMRQTFAFGHWDAPRFSSFLDRHEAFFPQTFSRPSFLDNHDMNRILWAMQGYRRRLKIAALCQFTLAGPPVIYYGTEVGLSQERDVRQGTRGLPEESRLPMLWEDDQDSELLAFYRALIALRMQAEALRWGARRTLQLGTEILAYTRSHAGKQFAVVINLASEPRQVSLDGSWGTIALATEPDCRLSYLAGGVRIDLPPLSGLVLGA